MAVLITFPDISPVSDLFKNIWGSSAVSPPDYPERLCLSDFDPGKRHGSQSRRDGSIRKKLRSGCLTSATDRRQSDMPTETRSRALILIMMVISFLTPSFNGSRDSGRLSDQPNSTDSHNSQVSSFGPWLVLFSEGASAIQSIHSPPASEQQSIRSVGIS